MSENPTPATKTEPGAEAGEFNFTKPAAENPRLRRRSLKAKSGGLIKPSSGLPPAALELKREAPPLSTDEIKPDEPKAKPALGVAIDVKPVAKISEPVIAPPRTTPTTPAASSQPATKANASQAAASTPATSPHGTRPATLYYSSGSNKEKEDPSPMKTTTAPRIASTTSPAAAATTATTRPAAATAAATTSSSTTAARATTAAATPTVATVASSPRPSGSFDYRANVERQSREQKSVGNILAYIVYTLIGLFVVGALLAGYGGYVLSKQIQQQSVTVSDLDARYAAATKDLNTKLTATQDTLAQAQAQIARQQELIVKQQEDINRLIAATNDNATALKAEKQGRLQGQQQGQQETANLRARLRDLEYKVSNPQKF